MGTIQYAAVVLGMLLGQNAPFSPPSPGRGGDTATPGAASSQVTPGVPGSSGGSAPSFAPLAKESSLESLEKTVPGQSGRRPSPPEMIAAAIPPRADLPTQTQPIRLADVLARPASRSKQMEIIRAYWDLATAVAALSFRKEELSRLQSLRVYPTHQQIYQAALSQATAAVQTAETALAEAQRTLIEKAALDPKAPRPWPADKPHIGSYRTRLKELFSGRPIPSSLQLIDRCLPWWQQAIDKRAAAVYAAEDALEALADAYALGRADLQQVLWAHARWCEQHTAFLQAIRAYNEEIAEFALAVAPQETSGSSLVSMLILANDRSRGTAGSRNSDSRRASWEESSSQDSGVQPAGYEEPLQPIPASPSSPEVLPQVSPEKVPGSEGRQEPTLAPPRELSSSEQEGSARAIRQEPTLAPPRETGSAPASSSRTASEAAGDSKASGVSEKSSLPAPGPAPSASLLPGAPGASGASESLPPGAASLLPSEKGRLLLRPLAPLPEATTSSSSPVERTAFYGPPLGKPPAFQEAPRPTDTRGFLEETLAFYPGLTRATPAVQVKQLALAFHGPSHNGEKLQQESLGACLRRVSSAKRREVIETYWVLWQQRAELLVLSQQMEMLEELSRLVLESRNRPLGAEAMLQLRVVRLAQEADRIEAQIRLLERETKLAQHLGMAAEGKLAPSTLPHAGPYQLRLEAQPKSLVESWPVRRAAGLIPALYASLQDQAETVVATDQSRTELIEQYRQGRRSLEDVLNACDQQKQATLNFLQTLTDYNQAIADYVVLVVPQELPPEVFVQTLVVDK